MPAAGAARRVPGDVRAGKYPADRGERTAAGAEGSHGRRSRADRYAPGTLSASANRRTLREVLAAGLDDTVVFGSEVTGYDAGERGVRVSFADGREAEADVLVGADGVNSAVRRQYLPAAAPADTGRRCVYGKTPLRPAALELLPAALDAGFTAVIGGRLGMATGLVRFRNRSEQVPGIRLSAAEDYLMWGLAGDRGQYGVPDERLLTMSPAELHALSAALIRSWHPDLRALHAMADIEETFVVRIRTSPFITAWPSSRVTVLGDAIHAMSPAAGSGANTALADAAQLHRALTTAADGNDITAAIGEYEHQMRDYGYAALAASAKAETERGILRSPVMRCLYRRAGQRSSR